MPFPHQRILVLLASMLAAMAANAVFFGYEPSNVGAQVFFSILSTLIMLPFTTIFPKLFHKASDDQSDDFSVTFFVLGVA